MTPFAVFVVILCALGIGYAAGFGWLVWRGAFDRPRIPGIGGKK